MSIRIDEILAVAISGIREGEGPTVCALIEHSGLHTEDITPEMLKNFLVARKGDKIIGAVGLEIAAGDALLRSLCIAKDFRGQGIAKKLTDSIERYARSRGVTTLYLLTLTAAAFFEKRGYLKTDRQSAPTGIQATQEFARLCPDTAVCLTKQVVSPAA